LILFLWCWRLNPGPWACYTSTLTLNHTIRPRWDSFNMTRCLIFWDAFTPSNEMIVGFCHAHCYCGALHLFIYSWIFNHPFILGINSTWPWWIDLSWHFKNFLLYIIMASIITFSHIYAMHFNYFHYPPSLTSSTLLWLLPK
jgi:hypothetical protein